MVKDDVVWEKPEEDTNEIEVVEDVDKPPVNSTFASRRAARLAPEQKAIQRSENK